MNDSESIAEQIGFVDLKKNIMADGAIDRRTKKLLAVASAVAVGCDNCFEAQKEFAKNIGITDEEIQEAIQVGALIRFGSGFKYMRTFD
ncbi:AhpD family alkylhydroperoxidase [Methanohalophilus levihalophilus]|uniref:carboxymuconolactone decarboxylase family protein n=1 Tax=Methanohalophilus levihalophilus TaxID=1431282 RepID=UPI001AE26521|nr:carboxymuconolactone decarboxylase family protein [Methanohalophilus levihalophilus]MBP2030313.1 AhpD family alkylhydroperoxidase [Methanohalophilus levihalophilus]